MIDAISYIAVIASLLAMTVEHKPRRAPTSRAIDERRDGFRYVVGFPPMWSSLLLLALVATMGMPYSVLMSAVAASVLHAARTHLDS